MKIERPISIVFDDKNNDALYYWLGEDERNPAFWVQLVNGLNYDIPFSTELAHWIVKQDDCDIGTAVLVTALFEGWLFFYEDVAKKYDGFSNTGKVIKTICDRSESGLYKSNNVGGLPDGLNQKSILSSVDELQGDPNYDTSRLRHPIPKTILTAKLPKTPFPKYPFLVDESGVYHLDGFSDETRKLWEMGLI